MRKNQKKNKFGNHLHINETPFHVDVSFHPAERYITDKGAVPKQACGTPKATSVPEGGLLKNIYAYIL